jgi:hypothetical protein
MKYLTILLFAVLLSACGVQQGDLLSLKTADPNLTLHFRLIQPVSAPEVAPDVLPDVEVGEIVPDPLPTPPCIIVKGNLSRDGRKLYHVEGMRNFNQVKISEVDGERFFCDEQSAIDAGWARAGN